MLEQIQAETLLPLGVVSPPMLAVITPADKIENAPRGDYFSYCSSLVRNSYSLASHTCVPDWVLFQDLIHQWHVERGATSSITEMAMCRSYLRIISIGPRVIPLIFRQLENEGDEPDMWFVALQMLTGADPVTEEARGNFKAMADLWLAWGRSHWYAR